MGYYSDLTITVGNDVKSFDEIDKTVRELSKLGDEWQREDEGREFSMTVNAKWYQHREFARHLSSCYPEVEFMIHRVGEGVNEEWDEERYKVKGGDTYDDETLVVKTEWVKVTEEEKRCNKALDDQMMKLRADLLK